MATLPVITVGPAQEADIVGNDDRALQAAVDRAAAAGGGEVRILPGIYRMENSLHLRSNVRVAGAGERTVLRKAPSVSSPIAVYHGYGHYDISVTHPERFRVGMGVHISDERSGGFYDTVATLVRTIPGGFGIDRMLNHDYSPRARGRVATLFPVVSACYVENIQVESITIDGNKDQNERLNGCRGGGVFLLQAHGASLAHLHVRDYNGDGISFQQCRDTLVQDCRIEGMTGHGLHPGSGSVGARLCGNICRNNGGDGIFYCLRVRFSLCTENRIQDNLGAGISIGGRDTDNWILKNHIHDNGGAGILFRPMDRATAGHRNFLDSNRLENNCRNQDGAEIEVHPEAGNIHVAGNRFRPAPRGEAGICALRVHPGAGPVFYWNNSAAVSGRPPAPEIDAPGENPAAVLCAPPPAPLAVGPDAAPPDAAAHLFPG